MWKPEHRAACGRRRRRSPWHRGVGRWDERDEAADIGGAVRAAGGTGGGAGFGKGTAN